MDLPEGNKGGSGPLRGLFHRGRRSRRGRRLPFDALPATPAISALF